MSTFVTISTHPTSLDAHMHRALLESNEISAFVKGDYDPYSPIYLTHQFEVQVRKDDLVKARALIEKQEAVFDLYPGVNSCPECASTEIENIRWNLKTVLAFILSNNSGG